MAYSYVWPTALPQVPQKGYTETGGVLMVRTPQDSGPAKMRYRGLKPQVLNLSFLMTSTQVASLDNFIKTTIKGTSRFGFTHPRTGAIVEVRIVPQGEGDYYTMTYQAPGYYMINTQFEVLP
jgi:hypothetical protein